MSFISLMIIIISIFLVKNHHLPAVVDLQFVAVIERWPAYTVVSIDRFQLAVIERWPAYTASSLYKQVTAGCNREMVRFCI